MINPHKITSTDKLLAATVLKLFPKRITPNQLTIFRFFAIPFIAFLFLLGEYILSLVVFFIAIFSDALDGALARTTKKVTQWGTTFDPVADKLLIGITAFVILPKYINLWLVFSVIFLEMTIIGFGYYYRTNKKAHLIRANWWGKSKMLSQSIGILLVLIYILFPFLFLLAAAEILLLIAIFLAIISLITYSL